MLEKKQKEQTGIAIDTETTGLDPYHGCRAFVITTCNEDGNQVWWETDVNPKDRSVQFPNKDLLEFKRYVLGFDLWYFQNPVFDMTFLHMAGCKWAVDHWNRVRDVSIAAHLVSSGTPKKERALAPLALRYLKVDIQPYEDRLKREVRKAQNYARRHLSEWRIAPTTGKYDPMMPSGGGWKADMWVLKPLANYLGHIEEHCWRTVAQDYWNVDSAATIQLCKELESIIRHRGLWKIYIRRLKLLEINYAMQAKGITANSSRLFKRKRKYDRESTRLGRKCLRLARSVGAELTLPKSGNNNSLKETVFNHFGIESVAYSKKTGEPSLNKRAIETMLETVNGKAGVFLRSLKEKRLRDTASGTYLTGYVRAWLPAWLSAVDPKTGVGWYVLHPSLNPVGTDTLRWSSSNPNEQNISKKEGFNLRYCFGPAEGREWWSMDAQNLELRIPGYESGEEELISLFEKPNEPPYYGSEHLLNFSTVYPDIWEKELKEVGFEKVGPHIKKKYAATWYQWCKNGDFAVGYGAVDLDEGGGTADKAFHRNGSHALLKSRFANKESLNQSYIEFANKHGYVETLPDKYVNPDKGYPIECPFTERGTVKPTIPLNYHVQSTAMWFICEAMIRAYRFLEQLNKSRTGMTTAKLVEKHLAGEMLDQGWFLVMQVHDEIVFDFPRGRTELPWEFNLPIIRKLKYLMELGGKGIGIPCPVSVEYHEHSWDVGVSVEL